MNGKTNIYCRESRGVGELVRLTAVNNKGD